MLVRETYEIRFRTIHKGCRRNPILSVGARQRTGVNNLEFIGVGSSGDEEKGRQEKIDKSLQRRERRIPSLLGRRVHSSKLNAIA